MNWELTELKRDREEQDELLRELDAEVNRLNLLLSDRESELRGV